MKIREYLEESERDVANRAAKRLRKELPSWDSEPKKRCKSCGAFLIKGKCPVDKKDCGRP